MNKFSALAVGSLGGLSLYYFMKPKPIPAEEKEKPEKIIPQIYSVPDSSETNNWDANWDHRQPNKNPRAIRHIIMVRHGQYNMKDKLDEQRTLTEIGRQQSMLTGQRIAELELPVDTVVMSTMKRAQETGDIIISQLPTSKPLKIVNDKLIREGEPIQEVPMNASENYPLPHEFFQEGARIEAGFRAHFHRAPPSQESESYTLLVCHANVIRYLVCRALQLPPEFWLNFNLHNGSISWLSVNPNGRVTLRLFGDCGHMPMNLVTRT